MLGTRRLATAHMFGYLQMWFEAPLELAAQLAPSLLVSRRELGWRYRHRRHNLSELALSPQLIANFASSYVGFDHFIISSGLRPKTFVTTTNFILRVKRLGTMNGHGLVKRRICSRSQTNHFRNHSRKTPSAGLFLTVKPMLGYAKRG